MTAALAPRKPLKAYLNVLKLRANMALRRPVVGTYPVMAMIEPTLTCNLRCPACPTGLQLGLRPAATLKAETFRAIIDEIGDYVFHLSMYNWGEPLLHKQTPDFIAYAKQRSMTVSLSSNLSLHLGDEYVDRLVSSGLDEILIGLDGSSAETYAQYRRRGEFDLVRANMLKIQAAKKRLGLLTPKLTWQFLVFKHNEHEIEEARTRHREWGADDFLVFGAEMPTGAHAAGFEPSTIPEYNRYHPDHPVQVRDRWTRKDDKACSWLYGVFVMNPDGRVSPCCATSDKADDFGAYDPERGFRAVWNSDRFRQARTMFKVRSFASPAPPPAGAVAAAGPSAAVPAELICQRCPIIYLQDKVHVMLARLALQYFRQGMRGLDLRSLLAFTLMGGPGYYALRIFVRKLLRGEEVWKQV
jgi:MoaA/NifB/PqqE/SkfB family radical SAM enzyme